MSEFESFPSDFFFSEMNLNCHLIALHPTESLMSNFFIFVFRNSCRFSSSFHSLFISHLTLLLFDSVHHSMSWYGVGFICAESIILRDRHWNVV